MSKRSNNERKNGYRKLENERIREERVICGYIKYRYPDMYNEANEYYQWLNQLYPTKKDLRKCNEFETLKHGTDIPIRKHYPRKITPDTHNIEDNMVLSIPLMDQDDIQSVQTPTTPNETTVEIEETGETVVVQTSSLLETPFTEPFLSDDLLEQIVNDLRKDPDISDFFENIDYEMDECPLW